MKKSRGILSLILIAAVIAFLGRNDSSRPEFQRHGRGEEHQSGT